MKNQEILNSFADRLLDLVSEAHAKTGLTNDQIAVEIDISPSALSKYLNAQSEPGMSALCKIADYFGVSSDYLLCRDMCSKPEIQALQNSLGLSEGAILNLRLMNESHTIRDLDIISSLIEKSLRNPGSFQKGEFIGNIQKEFPWYEPWRDKYRDTEIEAYARSRNGTDVLGCLINYFIAHASCKSNLFAISTKGELIQNYTRHCENGSGMRIFDTRQLAEKGYYDELLESLKKAADEYAGEQNANHIEKEDPNADNN